MFEKKERLALTIYLHYNRDARKLNQYGDILYHSRRMRYALLYVNQEDAEQVVELLKKERFVKKVLPSYVKEIDQDFVGNLSRMKEKEIKL